ncbi:MAG TPA: hypothetical protein VF669_02440 [Tepidisphaeraceae bacterium]|jgi:hypothetical protein
MASLKISDADAVRKAAGVRKATLSLHFMDEAYALAGFVPTSLKFFGAAVYTDAKWFL